MSEGADAAAALFSNAGQELQERTAVVGLLRVLGVEFRNDEIIKRGPEPVDVWFRDARFQVTEILDKGRPRNLELKMRATRIRATKRLKDTMEAGTVSSRPLPFDELVTLLLQRSNEKAHHYGGDCTGIDLLTYVNLKGRHVSQREPFPAFSGDVFSDWRSVSVVMEHFGMVLWASEQAPSFLLRRQGQPYLWQGLDSIFQD